MQKQVFQVKLMILGGVISVVAAFTPQLTI